MIARYEHILPIYILTIFLTQKLSDNPLVMRFFRLEDDKFSLTEIVGNNILRSVILLHTWGPDDEEVIFKDLVKGTGKNKTGYNKILFCGK